MLSNTYKTGCQQRSIRPQPRLVKGLNYQRPNGHHDKQDGVDCNPAPGKRSDHAPDRDVQ
jgi:hypothetical protein